MSKNTIDIKQLTLRQLLQSVDEGRFAIPKLQREFVWDGAKAAKLLDSIHASMPIGVIMVWETPRNQRLHLRQKYHILPPFNPHNTKVWFLIDGQQRLSVLYHVREGNSVRNAGGKIIDFDRVVLALEKQEDGQQIRYRKKSPGRFESLSDILHPSWKQRLAHLGTRDMRKVKSTRDRLLRYPMQLMFVQSGIKEIRESFLRINTQGMKITTADAIFSKAEGLDLRDFHHDVLERIDGSFGQIPEMPILFAIAAVRGAKEARGAALRREINRLEEAAKSDHQLRKNLAKDWNRLVTSFGKAVDFLRQNFMVLNRDYLYSDYMTAMLALFYYWNGRGPSMPQKEQIRRWFWATTVGARYSGRNFLRCVPADAVFFKRLAVNPKSRFSFQPQVDSYDVRRSQYASRTGITTAFYCMLLKRRPVSILDDGLNEFPLDRYSTTANRKDRHHIFPRSILHAVDIPPNSINSISNICLLTAEENQQIGGKRPKTYLGEVRDHGTWFLKKMSRHLIPVDSDSAVWSPDVGKGFQRFLRQRTQKICTELEKEAGMRLFRRGL